MTSPKDKSHRAAASQFFVAGELCRRGLVAVLTLGNCPNTDVLVSNKAGTRFAHVQVKTYRPGKDKTVTVGVKAEIDYGPDFFWVLAGIPEDESMAEAEYFIIPASKFSKMVSTNHKLWEVTPGKNGRPHSLDNKVRAVHIPPFTQFDGKTTIAEYRNQWDLILMRCDDRDSPQPLLDAREDILSEADGVDTLQ